MVLLGREHTVSVTMEEMLHHCKAAARGAKHPLLVGDMPFLSYQVDVKEAIRNAGRFLKEGGMDVVKLEGGREIAPTVKALVDAGIPVMGHIGLTPQTVSRLGGYRVQGKDVATARALIEDALALEDAGQFCLSLEAVPSPVAKLITERVSIPTIGIGSGPHCDGQTLLIYDVIGLFDRFVPKFVKQYANVMPTIMEALQTYRQEIIEGKFPGPEHSYGMSDESLHVLLEELNSHT
jgi:3-methyl-2-oxobutanoate hydroxymethyltransferase